MPIDDPNAPLAQPIPTPEELSRWAEKGSHWTSRLVTRIVKGEAKVIATEENVCVALRGSSSLMKLFRKNLRTGMIEVSRRPPWDPYSGMKYPRPIQDMDVGALRSKLCAMRDNETHQSMGMGLDVSVDLVSSGIDLYASLETGYDPVVQYLDKLVWDGVPRLDSALERYFDAVPLEVTRVMWRRWMVSAVKRAKEPGCQCDHMLILSGMQGRGKSNFLRILFTSEFHVDGFPNVENQYAAMQLEGQWCVEAGELSRFAGLVSQEALKQFLTTTVDKYKKPYGRHLTIVPRSCVFAGTTNERSVLNDSTGGRRFWMIELRRTEMPTEEMWAAIKGERDQLWAEAKALYEAKEPIYLEESMHREAAEALQDEARIDNPMLGKVETTLAFHRESLVTAVPDMWEVKMVQLLDWMGIPVPQYKTVDRAVGRALRELGWALVHKRLEDGRMKVWRKVLPPAVVEPI